MTDLERFLALYESVGLKPELATGSGSTNYQRKIHFEQKLLFTADNCEYTDGYYGFRYEVYFDADGKFVGHGIWE